MQFIKFQSLGNDFVLLDWLEKSDEEINLSLADPNWPEFVRKLCDRHFGIGADGVLIIRKNSSSQLEAMVFNADGSDASKCLNGLRCAAYYLVAQKNQSRNLEIFMGDRLMQCNVTDQVVINVGKVDYHKRHQLKAADKLFMGHIVNPGNPHFVVLQQVDFAWLAANGAFIEKHPDFPNRTNVEFVWSEACDYRILVYERGCGITLACGTGSAAVMRTLLQLGKISRNEKIGLKMPGGLLKSYIDSNDNIIQIAPADLVYKGSVEWQE